MIVAERARLQKAIAHAGLMSRRQAEEAISAGRVTIDGRVAVLGDRVDVTSEIVSLDGKPLPVNPESRTYLLYKPVGVISTADDPQGRQTVVNLVESDQRLYPVGRLDADSEGLILLTNDGDLANRVTHPRYGITKTYVILTRGFGHKELARVRSGVELDDGPAQPVSARILESSAGETLVEIEMGEGRNREIRRMFEAVGCPVHRLVRTSIGPISDPHLKSGDHRLLSNGEIRRLLASGRER